MRKKANVVISTPGRYDRIYLMNSVLDLMNLQLPREASDDVEEEKDVQTLSLDRINYIVVDEADRMLDISLLTQSLSLLYPTWVLKSN